jgi:YHS domain-containing protein
VITLWGGNAAAQVDAPAEPNQHESAPATADQAAHDMSSMMREGSGTSWLPDSSPMYAVHRESGAWTLMVHENVFVQFLHESGKRGDDQPGSINWAMGMAQRNVGPGHVGIRGMFSAEPWTIRGCGYPDLLTSGEQCNGAKIHDRQHPHDLVMEISVEYDAPMVRAARWQVYAGPAGEPALGPVAYPHRVSAMPNPLAPMTHHWLDSTHISFGVVTGGVYTRRWKAEASAFNGREPDEKRTDFDFGALDSVSGRVWFLPKDALALQISAGRLKEVEAPEGTGSRADVNKVTASLTFNRARATSIWASTVGWGRNAESGHATNALLVETNVTFDDTHTWFGRFEAAGKTPHDLDVATTSDVFTVAKLQGGYTRYVTFAGSKAGLGAEVSAGVVPGELRPVYGSRLNLGTGVFLTLRPRATTAAAHAGHTPGAATGAATMVMVQTAFDPTKLSCSPAIEPNAAASTTYEGKTYYFCSAADRDKFLTDPRMSLSMMPPKQ